jgi:hypothetical protein
MRATVTVFSNRWMLKFSVFNEARQKRCKDYRSVDVIEFRLEELGFQAEGELFDYRIGEDFASDAFHLKLLSRFGVPIFERQEKVFALADIGDAFIFHAAESVGDCFALSVKDRAFERDIDMGLHCDRL